MAQSAVLCLMYHRLCTVDDYARLRGSERMFALPVDQFDRQIGYLASKRLVFMSAGEVEAFAARRRPMERGGVMITFDDGCRSVSELAAPVLRSHNAKATLFVATSPRASVFDSTPNDPRLSDEDIAELDGETVQIESHSVTHPALSGLNDNELRRELSESRRHLEGILHRDVFYFAIPGNWYNRRVLREARHAGYRAVWCSNPGWVRRGSSGFPFPRVNIDGDITLDGFIRQISPWGVARRRIFVGVKRAPGRILGPRVWDPVRRAILSCVPGGYLSMRRVGVAGLILVAIVALAVIVMALR